MATWKNKIPVGQTLLTSLHAQIVIFASLSPFIALQKTTLSSVLVRTDDLEKHNWHVSPISARLGLPVKSTAKTTLKTERFSEVSDHGVLHDLKEIQTFRKLIAPQLPHTEDLGLFLNHLSSTTLGTPVPPRVLLARCDGEHLHLRSAEALLQYFMQRGLAGWDDPKKSFHDGTFEEELQYIEGVANPKEFHEFFEKYKAWALGLGGKWWKEVSPPTY